MDGDAGRGIVGALGTGRSSLGSARVTVCTQNHTAPGGGWRGRYPAVQAAEPNCTAAPRFPRCATAPLDACMHAARGRHKTPAPCPHAMPGGGERPRHAVKHNCARCCRSRQHTHAVHLKQACPPGQPYPHRLLLPTPAPRSRPSRCRCHHCHRPPHHHRHPRPQQPAASSPSPRAAARAWCGG